MLDDSKEILSFFWDYLYDIISNSLYILIIYTKTFEESLDSDEESFDISMRVSLL